MVKTGRKAPRRNLVKESLTIFSAYQFKTPDDVEALYLFREGEYIQGEPFVKGTLESKFDVETSTGLCGEVIGHLKRRSYVPRSAFNNFNGEIPVLNGLLNLDTGAQTLFTPDKIFTFKIQANYNPDKHSEKWVKFLEEVLPNEDDRLALQEYAGYCLYPKMPYHKIAFLVGSGRNGKGVFVRTIQSILGTNNVSNIRIDYLNGGHRFAATNLYGKLMNVSSEPSTRWPLETELLKALTGEDWLDGEVKGKQNPVRFQPFAKHFVLANKLPKVNDTSLGWWDRVLIVIWLMTFTEENGKQITDLEESWLSNDDDRSGILNWLIEGWMRLKNQRKFTQSKTQREAMIQFKRASDPIAAFLAEECEYDLEYFELRDTIYNAYKDYAKSLNAEPEGTKTFWERMKSVPGVTIDRKKRVLGKNERVVLGLKLRNREVDALEDFIESDSGADGADGAGHPSRQKSNDENNKKEEVETPAPSAPSAPPLEQSEANEVASVSSVEENLNIPNAEIGNTSKPITTNVGGDNSYKLEEVAPVAEDNDPPIPKNLGNGERSPLDADDKRFALIFSNSHGCASTDYVASQLRLTEEAAMFRLKMLKQRGWVDFDLISGIWRWLP